MNTIQWTCDECDEVNVVVVAETDTTTLTCRECAKPGKLVDAKPVLVINDIPAVHHSGH